jgi:hypothetical protein
MQGNAGVKPPAAGRATGLYRDAFSQPCALVGAKSKFPWRGVFVSSPAGAVLSREQAGGVVVRLIHTHQVLLMGTASIKHGSADTSLRFQNRTPKLAQKK